MGHGHHLHRTQDGRPEGVHTQGTRCHRFAQTSLISHSQIRFDAYWSYFLGSHGATAQHTGEFEVGALSARHIAPERIAQGSITATRQAALLACRASEEQTKLSLRAAAVASASAELSCYLLEWAKATTVTDLKDIPDGLLSQIPKLDDPSLATMLFSCTSNMPHTKSFTPPAQRPTDFKPKDIGDIKHQSKLLER